MRLTGVALSAVFLAMMVHAATASGDIQGHLSITRTLTKKRVVLPDYSLRGVVPNKSSHSVNKPISEWERIVVYLEGSGAPTEPETAVLNQTGERFEPAIVVVPAGSTVSFPNSDPIFHNVFSLSKARQFDLGYYPEGDTRKVRFPNPGVVDVYCHLHPDMNATILVVPNGWYTRPDAQGSFSFADLNAGTYQVVVWHKSAGFFRKKVRVSDGGTASIAMDIPIEVDEL